MLNNLNSKCGIFTKVRSLTTQFPLLRGMLTYAIIWPTSSIAQQYIENGTSIKDADFARAARFSIFGAFFMAPVFHGWMKLSSIYFKRMTLTTVIKRVAIEQIIYSPFAVSYFFFGMCLIEYNKPLAACVNEVREKFWPTYTAGFLFWPIVQTVNFCFISERNRIVFVGAAGFVWTIFLAHIKAMNEPRLQKAKPSKSETSP